MVLPILDINEQFDFQKKGNHLSVRWGVPVAPINSLLTFSFKVLNGTPLTSFELRKVRVFYDNIIQESAIDLITVQKPVETVDGDYMIYTQDAKYLPSNNEAGLHYFYFTDGTFERKSELFCINENILLTDLAVFIIDDGFGNPVPFQIIDNLGNLDYFYIKK